MNVAVDRDWEGWICRGGGSFVLIRIDSADRGGLRSLFPKLVAGRKHAAFLWGWKKEGRKGWGGGQHGAMIKGALSRR